MRKKLAAFVLGTLLMGSAVANVSAAEYEVEKGDSLWSIAEDHDTTVEKLIEINDLRTTLIKPKQELVIDETYQVQKGDTLISIAKQYGVTPDDLKKWNQLDHHIIKPGQTLTIYDPIFQTEKQVEPKAEVKEATATASQSEKPEGKTLTVTATAYTAECKGCTGITYTGVNLNQNRNAKVIAVDPNVIPLGSKVYVEGYGYATAEDTGGAIKGNKIDLHVPTTDEAYEWGVRKVKVTVLD